MNSRSLSMQRLDKESLSSFLKTCPLAKRYLLAVSGGLDSCVLLHLFFQLPDIRQNVQVVHIDHRLQDESKKWADFTAELAREYGFTFNALSVSTKPAKGDSIEDWARTERYSLLKNELQDNDVLFTAHHLDDQVETFFLQALRGAGPRGLAAMTDLQAFSRGWLARPLLRVSRRQLEDYAETQCLKWVEDPSNIDTTFDRNYLRQNLFSILECRWPAYRQTISRLIAHQHETREMLDELASQDLALLYDNEQRSLDMQAFCVLSESRQKNILLHWARQQGLATPNSRHLQQIVTDLLQASADATTCVNWADVEMRRYRDRLYLFRALPAHEPARETAWNICQPLVIDGEKLCATSNTGKGISVDRIGNKRLTVRFRQGGEKINVAQVNGRKSVKQLFQEAGILPWWRDRVPLIYLEDKLIAIPGIATDEQMMAGSDENAVEINWTGLSKSIETHG